MEEFKFIIEPLNHTNCYYIKISITYFNENYKKHATQETSFLPSFQIISYLTEKQIKNKVKKFNGWIDGNKLIFKDKELALKAAQKIFEPGIMMRKLTNKSVMKELYCYERK